MQNSLPDELLDRLRLVSPNGYKQILDALQQKRPTTLRINPLKTTSTTFLASAAAQQIQLKPVTSIPNAFVLTSPSLREFSETQLYLEGHCYVQSLSSMIPPLVLQPQKDDIMLDIAAAPGSKTTQMAAMMNNTGEIVANDTSQIRLYKLEANLQRLGVTNVRVRRGAGQTIWQEYPNYFDRVLVDVPCSMEGRIHIPDPKTYEHWSTKKIKELVPIQRFLLKSAVSAVKPGGVIVYATCTMSPEENEGVIDWILRKSPAPLAVEDITEVTVPSSPALLSWKERQYNPEVAKTLRIPPSELFEGFYVAKLRKQ